MSADAEIAIEDLDRDELEQRVQELEQRVDDLEPVGAVIAKLVNELRDVPEEDEVGYGDSEFLPVAVKTFSGLAGQIETHDETLQRHDSVIQDSRTAGCDVSEHWWNVVEAAQNLQGSPENGLRGSWVKLYKENIAQATGLSEKRGQQLIDEWTNEADSKYKQGTKKQPYEPATPANNNHAQKKALLIDLDVWEVDE